MDEAIRATLEARAWDELLATAEDDPRWSFVTEAKGAISFMYCPWSQLEDWDFDGGTEGLDLPWTPDRRNLIESGEDEPTEDELAQWRRAMCHRFAEGSDWTSVAWIVPLRTGDMIDGYVALVFGPDADPYEPPFLQGVYESAEAARAALAVEGAIGGSDADAGEVEELDEE